MTRMKKVDALLAQNTELDAVLKQHEAAFKAYKDTPATDPSWTEKLNELNRIGVLLKEKVAESKKLIAEVKGFSSYDDMINSQPVGWN